MSIERAVRETLAVVDGTTPLAVGEPLIQRCLKHVSHALLAEARSTPVEALDVIQWIRERLDFDPCHECDNATIANDRLDEAEARLRSPESD